jgi:UDP-N-acetylmuramate--alanine ligase
MLTIWIFMDDVTNRHHLELDKVEDKSQLFITKDLPLTGVTVAVDEDATVLLTLESKMVIRYKTPKGVFVDLRFGLPGKHNLMNALMAIAMAQIFGTNRGYCTMAG